jgi:NAD(P)-dependent dehydrogenase (short-subunit alcohol dehydrogenase family)
MKFTISETIPRTALITGGMRQWALVNALTGAGFAVALQCLPGDETDGPAGVVPLPADLSDEAQTAALLGRAAEALGPIGVLINAANTIERDTWDEATRATWDMHIETNLRAPFVLIQHFAKALPAAHEGVVINLLDQRLCPHLVSYTLSKAALWTLTQTMALALAPRVRVNGIDPGPAPGSQDEVGRAALAILALSSMTGQMIVPDGVPPPPA